MNLRQPNLELPARFNVRGAGLLCWAVLMAGTALSSTLADEGPRISWLPPGLGWVQPFMFWSAVVVAVVVAVMPCTTPRQWVFAMGWCGGVLVARIFSLVFELVLPGPPNWDDVTGGIITYTGRILLLLYISSLADRVHRPGVVERSDGDT